MKWGAPDNPQDGRALPRLELEAPKPALSGGLLAAAISGLMVLAHGDSYGPCTALSHCCGKEYLAASARLGSQQTPTRALPEAAAAIVSVNLHRELRLDNNELVGSIPDIFGDGLSSLQ